LELSADQRRELAVLVRGDAQRLSGAVRPLVNLRRVVLEDRVNRADRLLGLGRVLDEIDRCRADGRTDRQARDLGALLPAVHAGPPTTHCRLGLARRAGEAL